MLNRNKFTHFFSETPFAEQASTNPHSSCAFLDGTVSTHTSSHMQTHDIRKRRRGRKASDENVCFISQQSIYYLVTQYQKQQYDQWHMINIKRSREALGLVEYPTNLWVLLLQNKQPQEISKRSIKDPTRALLSCWALAMHTGHRCFLFQLVSCLLGCELGLPSHEAGGFSLLEA